MKRERCESTTDCTTLPIELHLEMMQHDWTISGPWARTSKHNLWCMTRPVVLSALIKWCKENQSLRWLRFSLPHHWIMESDECRHIQRLKSKFDTILGKRPLPAHNQCCLTGGLVTRLLYGREWRSDIDIWVAQNDETESSVKRQQIAQHLDNGANLDWDIVWCWRTKEQWVFEEFDLSVVQQGYCASDCQFYLTPLALYSYQSHEIIIAPTDLTVGYMGHCQTTLSDKMTHENTSTVNDALASHKRLGHMQALHNCVVCRNSRPGCTNLLEWLDRIARYEKRFPDFSLSYFIPVPMN